MPRHGWLALAACVCLACGQPAWQVSTLVGSVAMSEDAVPDFDYPIAGCYSDQFQRSSHADGALQTAVLAMPFSLLLDSAHHRLYVGDYLSIRVVDLTAQTVSTLAGPEPTGDLCGYADGSATEARFCGPAGLALGNGILYVTDNDVVRTVSLADGATRTIAGGAPHPDWEFADGPAMQARFSSPGGLFLNPDGSLLIADGTERIRLLRDGMVSTFAGTGTMGETNGDRRIASFTLPFAILGDGKGGYFVGERYGIRSINAQGTVASFSGANDVDASTETRWVADGSATTGSFGVLSGMALGPDGNLYVTDADFIRMIRPDGSVTTIAGSAKPGYREGPGLQARFDDPHGIAVDGDGTIYVADSCNYRIRVLRRK